MTGKNSRTTARILFIGFDSDYINPTNSLLPSVLLANYDTAFFGPGFVDEAILKAGLDKFCENNGPFDVYVTTSQLCLRSDVQPVVNFYSRNSVHTWNPELCRSFLPDVWRVLPTIDRPRICFLTDLDIYALSREQLDQLQECATHYVSWARGFSRPLHELEHLTRENFYERKKKTHQIGHWHDFVDAKHESFLNFSHWVSDQEFSWSSLGQRSYTACIPGQLYARRLDAREQLKKATGIRIPSFMYRKVFSALSRVGLKPYSRPLLQHVYRQNFIKNIRDSRCVITDGSGYDRPIRKFFEIPALGSVLVCWPCAGFEDLGFKDGENAIIIKDQRADDIVKSVLAEPERAQSIAAAGRMLIWKRHSTRARAQQFQSCLEAILKGTFAGSHWKNGEFIVEERS